MRIRAILAAIVLIAAPAAVIDAADAQEPSASRGAFILLHPPHLRRAADAWGGYRRLDGWTVTLASIDTSQPESRRRGAILNRIADAARAHRAGGDGGPLVVLLLGDADALPPHRFVQPDPVLVDPLDERFATDHPYQLLDRDDFPDVALGRVPARSDAEALAVLDKIKRYEASAPHGAWRRRINYAAGEGHFGAGLDALLELLFRGMIAGVVPDRYDATMTYAKPGSAFCPPPSQLTEVMLERLSEGALLFNYVGHGSAYGLDRVVVDGVSKEVLTVEDLERLDRGAADHPLALLTCCSAGWFDLPASRRSLGEAMLLSPGGPVAVIAGSRPTHPYANAVLQKDVTALLLQERVGTVGELDLRATRDLLVADGSDRAIDLVAAPIAMAGRWTTSLQGLRHMHARLYNLLGDPATRIAHPEHVFGELRIADDRLVGRTDGIGEGRVEVTIERDRLAPAAKATTTSIDDAAATYARANDLVLMRLTAELREGRLELPLPDPMPDGAAVIKVYAVGTDASGAEADAFGAVRVPITRPTPRVTERSPSP